MDIFNVLTLLGGVALFLFGMDIMGEGLKKQAGGKLKSLLERLTSSPLKGFALGAIITAIIQSSSATTVMVVGFVNSGIMKLSQAIGIIMGANVGTTITAWILSLTSIQGDSFLMKMLKPTSFSPIIACIGIILYMFSRNNRKKDIGSILLGFAMIMFGMKTMSSAVSGLADVPEFTQLFLAFSNPIIGVLVGALLTAIIQSSSASVGILQALSSTGRITFGSAVPIIMGQNIGTCVTAIISSTGANKNAKRAAAVHLYFNVIGTGIFLVLFYALKFFIDFAFMDQIANEVGIAIIHTCFNLVATIPLLPLTGLLEKLACKTIRDKDDEEEKTQMLDERLLLTPSVAISQCKSLTDEMAKLAQDATLSAISLVNNFDRNIADSVLKAEDKLDKYEDKLGTYLVKLSSYSLSTEDSHQVSTLLHTIGDFERIGDYAIKIMESAQEIHDKKISFSKNAQDELLVISSAVQEVLALTMVAFCTNDLAIADKIEPLEQVVDTLKSELKRRHVERLQRSECTIELGFIFSDLLTSYERLSDHCSNIAVCLIEVNRDSFDTHEYLKSVKTSKNTVFTEYFDSYLQKYTLK